MKDICRNCQQEKKLNKVRLCLSCWRRLSKEDKNLEIKEDKDPCGKNGLKK